MSLEDYSSIEETMYLLRSPKNAQRLYKALEQLKTGQYQKRTLIEEDEDISFGVVLDKRDACEDAE